MKHKALIAAAWLFMMGVVFFPPTVTAEIYESFEGENHARFMGAQVKERQRVMGDMAASLKTLKTHAYNPETLDENEIWAAQKTIERTAAELYEFFPDGTQPGRTGVGRTRARGKIWRDWDGFLMRIDNLTYAAEDMRSALAEGDPADMRYAVGQLGKTCAACHADFRAPKN
ncbi:MAG: c-type cytochrome [Alphaproteobacteria bacterium]